jgi:hypothetical protein
MEIPQEGNQKNLLMLPFNRIDETLSKEISPEIIEAESKYLLNDNDKWYLHSSRRYLYI